MTAVHATQDTFQKEVLDHKGKVVVDFHAEWCGPCKAMEPMIEDLSNELKDIKFVKVDVDANQEVAGKYSVFSIPTFLVIVDGQVKHQIVGAQSKDTFKNEIVKAA
ncbi:MAG: thioredoxin [Weeksellaceae bacterium]